MSTRFITEPWAIWPRKETPSYSRRRPFKTTYGASLSDLDREMRHLGAAQCIVQIQAKRSDIRADGLPRETMTTVHPGVILTFDRKGSKVPVTMPCDSCNHWQQNLRAIVLTLERLRLAELYGVTSNGEQYRGWEALPPPVFSVSAMTLEKALDVVAKWSRVPQNVVKEVPSVREAAIKEARRAVHPDKGGRPEDALEVAEAAELLKKELGA